MTEYAFAIRGWSAWSPGLVDLDQWTAWAAGGGSLPDDLVPVEAKFLPAALRRRCSSFTKASLLTAQACLDGVYAERPAEREVPSVFASRHGESEVTLSILKSLARREPVSPNHFSLSVHNAASGIFSIVNGNRSGSTALASGGDEVFALLVEALALLDGHSSHTGLIASHSGSIPSAGSCTNGGQDTNGNTGTPDVRPASREILCVCADAPLPQPFRSFQQASPFFALALVLAVEREGPRHASFTVRIDVPGDVGIGTRSFDSSPEGVLRWLLTAEPALLRPSGALPLVLAHDGLRAGGCFHSTERISAAAA